MTYLGFDFGMRRIGCAVGNSVTLQAKPLAPLSAQAGVPDWALIDQLIRDWEPRGLVVGIPTCIDDTPQYTTDLAKSFAQSLHERCRLPVYPVDERLTTKAARARLFAEGGYRQLQKSSIDSMAAVIILEQWLQSPEDSVSQ